MDDEILKTVESMLGKDIKIVDCEKTSSVREEEILLINGIPVQLEGSDGDAIKSALMTGQVPPCDLLNQLLYRAGILRQPVHLETSLSVKSSLIRKEEVTVARDGRILDERTSETQEDNIYTSSCKEIWEPVNKLGALKNIIPIPMDRCLDGDRQAFLLTVPPTPPPPKQRIPQNSTTIQNSSSNLRRSSKDEDEPSTSIAPSLSSASSASSTSNSSSTNNTTTGKSSIFTDCSASSLLTSPLKEPLLAALNDRRTNDDSNTKPLLNCISYDSGHGDLFNSLSQSKFLPTVTAAMSATNSNSISSCYDFLSSDETDFIQTKSSSISKEPSTDFIMPTIFGTVASDQCPKDNINRRGFPQTVGSCSTKSIDKSHQSHQHPAQLTQQTIDYHQQQAAPTHQQHHQQKQQHHHQQQQQQQQHHHQYHQPSLENDDNALVYRDGYLISGPLDTLVQHMVPTNDYYPDRSYLFAFLLSARLFIRPHELLAKICQLCDEQNFNSCRQPSKKDTAEQQLCHVDHAVDQHQSKSIGASCTQQATDVAGCTGNADSDSIAHNSDCCRKLRAFAQHFVQLLAEWIDTFPYDFRDERLMQHVRSMTRKCISIDSALRKDVSAILQNLLQRLTVLEKYEEFLLSLSRGGSNASDSTDSTSMPTVTGGTTTKSSSVLTIQNNLHDSSQPHHHFHYQQGGQQQQPLLIGQQLNSSSSTSSATSTSFDISELCSNPTLLAHQLTHIELERLSYIGPEEFVQAFAKENPHLEQSFSDMKKTRNLESYVQWFNRLSYLVATEIVKHSKKKQRVRIVEYWIETARECFNIGNFNSLMAIIAGLNMSPISRLKKTWAKVQSAKFSVLEHQMDPSSNFNSYRSTLKAAMWRSAGATDERERIVIPFFSLLVKDLYFLNEGCSNKLVNGHINFEKFWQLAKQVTEFIAWKQVTCPFEKLPKVIMFLQTNNVLNENTLALASFECEPPDNNHEKDRYKSLKSEQQQ